MGRFALTFGFVAISWLARSTVAMDLPSPVRSGPDADDPPFVTERNGVFHIPWGAGNYSWPEQMFWESKSEIKDKGDIMRNLADQETALGRVASMSCVAWGYEYKAATGGDSALGFADMSHKEGWQQWGEWIAARKDKYLAQDWDGKILYPAAGYITPMMPLDKEDWPPGIDSATYGDWSGWKLGTLANEIHTRGFFAADFVVGLYGGNHDFHPRVIDDFERWAGVKVPGASVTERAAVVKNSYWARYNDFKSDRFARFYARAANTIRSSGREPLVGGQILPDAPMVRGSGNDFRIYLRHLPAKNWFFQVELQSDEGRPVPTYWTSATYMGIHAARAPDFPLGAQMDASSSNFWGAVKNTRKAGDGLTDSVWGNRYLKHAWLSVGWTHVANTDGSVRRAPLAFQRSYWDAGGVDTPIVALVRKHIPRHPFGPAVYYSTDLERQSEGTGNPNFYYWVAPKAMGWRQAGVPAGYFVSDTALANLKPENRPSGWFVYVDNLGLTSLNPGEKARLENIAPILTEKDVRDSCPVSFEGDSLGGYAFLDSAGSVIVVVSNAGSTSHAGWLNFAKVENGRYALNDLLDNTSGVLGVVANKSRFPFWIEARDTKVFEIPGLRERGRAKLLPWNGPIPDWPQGPGIGGVKGLRVDILGRISGKRPSVIWSAPVP